MAKSSPTLHQPPRTARPDELAEENRRTEEALAEELAEEALRLRAPSGFILEPKSELALEAEAYQKSRNELVNGVTLLERSWAPTTPVEVVAAFQVMAEWVARVEEELDELQEEELDELQIGRVAELERRLALLEQRLDPDTDYRPAGLRYDGRLVSFDDEDRKDPLAMLWANHHEPDGTRSAPKGGVMDEPLDDIENGHLRPHTWAQICDCLSEIAGATHTVLSGLIDMEDGARPMQQLVANLTRAVAGTSPRPPHDVAEALVLETVTRLLVDRREKEAWQVESMWRIIDDYSQDRYKSASFKKNWKLVRADAITSAE